MPKIIINNLFSKAIDCKNKKERLLDILLAETDWMHACGGKGRCTSCRAIVLSGQESLGPLSDAENRFRDQGRLKLNERLTCQVMPGEADLVIDVPESAKFPHLTYSS